MAENRLSDTAPWWRVVPDRDGWAIAKGRQRILHFAGPDADLHAQRAADKRNRAMNTGI